MSRPARVVAVTGATGFVGRHAVVALARAGWRVRVLARSEPAHALWRDLEPEVVLGSLQDHAALKQLVQGAEAVVHLAGAIKARDAAAFMRVNCDGTAALAEASSQAGSVRHFLHISSQAASQPQLSGYCASKLAGEAAALGLLGRERVSVLRPPAVYGPGDRETLVFFKLAGLPLVPLIGPPSARLAVIHIADAVAAMLARLESGPSGLVQGIADHRPAGYDWRAILSAAAAAVGNRKPRFLQMPRPLLQGAGLGAGVAARLAGRAAMFNPGKLRELLHENWSVPRETLFSPAEKPRHDLESGFAQAAAWYRQAGWL